MKNEVILLVRYDKDTTLVNGYFIKNKEYKGNIVGINDIDGFPFIEISINEQVADKQMCVVDGIYQEYIKPDNLVLEEKKLEKIAQCKKYLKDTGWQIERLCDPSSGEPLKEGVAENRALARSLQNEIEDVTADGEYVDENNQPITPLQYLENININFN